MSWGYSTARVSRATAGDPRVRVGAGEGEVTVRPNWPVVALGFVGLTATLVWLGALFGRSAS